MKYLSIFRFSGNLLLSLAGKVVAFIVAPLVFPHRDWINNYVHNFIQANGLKLNRSTIWKEEADRYLTKDGYIMKRKINKFLGYLLLYPWFNIDNDASLTSCSLQEAKEENVSGLKIVGSYFDLGDRQRENNGISIWTNWQNFKDYYYWSVIRNGFYGFNYMVEDSYMNQCGSFDLAPNNRIHESWKPANFKEHSFYKDSNGKWFFIMTLSKIIKGKAYGYEIGWRRLNWGGVNAVVRAYWAKTFEKEK